MSLLDDMISVLDRAQPATRVTPVTPGNPAGVTRIPFEKHDGNQGNPGNPVITHAERRMRIFHFRLADTRPDGKRGYCTLIAPEWTLADASADLASRYGERLLEVRERTPVLQKKHS